MSDAITNPDEAFRLAAAMPDAFAGKLVHQGLIDVLATRSLKASDLPLHLDLLLHARCLAAIYGDRARILTLVRGAPSPIGADELRACVEAAEAAGAIKRGGEALAHVEALPEGPLRSLSRFGLGTSAALLATLAPISPPVDACVQSRLFDGSFRNTRLIELLAEGREPEPFL